MSVPQHTHAELIRIARRQKVIRCLIVVTFLTVWIPFASILVGIIAFPFIYRLGKALHSSGTWLFVVAAFIPFVDIASLLILNRIATVRLRHHQIRVGLTGARKEDLANLAARDD